MQKRSRAVLIAAVVVVVAGLPIGCDAQDRDNLGEERLAVMIDSLLPGIAEASGLEIRRPVRYAMQSREEAGAFIADQLVEELGLEAPGAMERAYRALGLISDTLDLRSLLLELLTEQVVGYYDPDTDRLYLVEGAPADMAGPVVAHELVHALQDQHTDLDSLVAPERGNDRQMAAQAAAEGQAMLVMVALQAAESTGQSIDPAALPDLGTMMQPALEAENARFPVFQRSPRLIRETLIFPYIGGARFVQALFRHRQGPATPVPFGDLLPQSTEQVMDPEGAFFGERDVPTELALGPPPEGWSVVYSNTLGKLELSILLDERWGGAGAAGAGETAASDAGGGSSEPGAAGGAHAGQDGAHGWDGDRFALLEDDAGREALVWYIVWDDAAAADRFVARYERWRAATAPGGADPGNASAGSRPPGFGPGTVERLEVQGRPVVRVVEAGPGVEPSEMAAPALESLGEERDS